MASRFSGLLQAPSKFVFREDEPEESVTPPAGHANRKTGFVAEWKGQANTSSRLVIGAQPGTASLGGNTVLAKVTSMHRLDKSLGREEHQSKQTARSNPPAQNALRSDAPVLNVGVSSRDSSDSGDGFVYKRQKEVVKASEDENLRKRKRAVSPELDHELEEARDKVAKLRARKRVMLGQAEAVDAELQGVVRKMKELEEERNRLREAKEAMDSEISDIVKEIGKAKSFLVEREKGTADLANTQGMLKATHRVPAGLMKEQGASHDIPAERLYAEADHHMQATSAAGHSELEPPSSSVQASNMATTGGHLNRRQIACLMERPIHQYKPRRIKICPWAPHLIASCSYYEKACGMDEAIKVYTSSTSSPQVLPGAKQEKYGRVVDVAWIGPETLAVGTFESRYNLWIWNMKKVGKSKYIVRDTPVAYERDDARYCMSGPAEGTGDYGIFAVGGADKTITVIKTHLQPNSHQAPSAVMTLTTKHSNAVHDMCFDHTNHIYSGGDDGRICVTDVVHKSTWEYAKLLRTADQASSLVKTNFIKFCPTNKSMLLTGSHGRDPVHLRLWDVRVSSDRGALKGISIPELEDISLYSRPAWSSCGRYVAVGLSMGLCIVDIRRAGKILTWPHPGHRPFGLAWHPTERTIYDISLTTKNKYKLFGHHY